MRLDKIQFTNFRCFKNDLITFNDYTSLVGPNNCGKSTALRALNIFFEGTQKANIITENDFYIGAPKKTELKINFEFSDVDGAAASELSHYVRNGKVQFEIIAHRKSDGSIHTKFRGIRFGIKEFAPFFAADKVAEKRPIYEQLADKYSLAAWKNKDQATEEIRKYESENNTDHIAIPSEENAYGITGPIPILKKYIDWIYIPAVKEASSETSEQKNSAFSKLIILAVRSRHDFSEKFQNIKDTVTSDITKLLEETTDTIEQVGKDIDRNFRNLTTTPINVVIDWASTEEISIKEPQIESSFKDGRVTGAPSEFGHGLQRTYIMALLSLVTKIQHKIDKFQLLLGIEEPELYQHPPQAKYLANALVELSKGNSQVIVTTHSPTFISGETFESIRVLKKKENKTSVHTWSLDEQRKYCAARLGVQPIGEQAALSGIDRTLQSNISELFFASKVILVEGIEDQAILESYLKHTNKYADFLRAGCHIIPVGGKTKMPMIIAMARGFSIDIFCLFDLDLDKPENKQNNKLLFNYINDLDKKATPPTECDYKNQYFYGWQHNIQHAILENCPDWNEIKQEISTEWGWQAKRMEKDPMLLDELVLKIIGKHKNIESLNDVVQHLEKFWKG